MTKQIVQHIDSDTMKQMYITMLKIRKFEERLADLLFAGEIKCPTHLYIGQEAIATGVCTALEKNDYVFSTHRSHGHYIAKGGDINLLMAEIYCKKTGCSIGRGGSMHVVAPEVGFMGSSSIVGGSLPLAVGAALASSLRKDNRVTVTFFGDGATDEGVFYESINFAALRKLPVLFVCENNLYSTHLRISFRQPDVNIYKKAELFAIPGFQIDGNNVEEVYVCSNEAIKRARNGEGPTLIECITYRWRAHVGPWHDTEYWFRTKEEVDKWIERCPIKREEEILLKQEILSKSEISLISKKIEQDIENSITFAKNSPFPNENELMNNIFKE